MRVAGRSWQIAGRSAWRIKIPVHTSAREATALPECANCGGIAAMPDGSDSGSGGSSVTYGKFGKSRVNRAPQLRRQRGIFARVIAVFALSFTQRAKKALSGRQIDNVLFAIADDSHRPFSQRFHRAVGFEVLSERQGRFRYGAVAVHFGNQ